MTQGALDPNVLMMLLRQQYGGAPQMGAPAGGVQQAVPAGLGSVAPQMQQLALMMALRNRLQQQQPPAPLPNSAGAGDIPSTGSLG